MKRLAVFTLLLAGCAHKPDPAVEVRVVEVPVEVQKPCPGEVPERPAPIGELPRDLRQLAALLGAKLTEYAGEGQYADQAEAYFRACPPSE